MFRSAVIGVLMSCLLVPPVAHGQAVSAYQFDPVLADMMQGPVLGSPKRMVIAERLEVRTRPIPEAAVLDVLRPGAMVGLVSEGGGWSTMDLGGGFLGWMRSDGLGPVAAAPPRPVAPKVAPVPIDPMLRPQVPAAANALAGEASIQNDDAPVIVRRF